MPEAYAGYTSDVPPALTFVMAGLGGFRGIVSEILWFRASRLQEEGRFFELVQLADWLTMLDPHAAETWSYNAWNLAYNISVIMARDEDRLRWVLNGISLLRDDGLRFNPREARLYRELAWLYQNKIGDNLDSAHLTYKRYLAKRLVPCVNPDGTVIATEENRNRLTALHLDLDRMLRLEKRFGPLDWRIAESHAVYWASQGLEYAQGTERLMCRRAIYQPLILSAIRGRFTGNLEHHTWQTSANPALVIPAVDFLAETVREFPSRTMKNVYIRYLIVAMRLLNDSGNRQAASMLYKRFLSSLPEGLKEKPTFEDILKGWKPENEN